MKYPEIDESKLPEVMKIIDTAANLMAEKDCETDMVAKQELNTLQKQLIEVTGNPQINIRDYRRYWAATNLETVGRSALYLPPKKTGLTDAQLTELIRRISELDFDVPKNALEATNDYFLEVLEVETGLDNITDYIYWPEEAGLAPDASLDEITAKILTDKK